MAKSLVVNVLLYARRSRAYLNHAHRGWMFFLPLGLAAGALFLIVDGDVIAACGGLALVLPAAWLGEVWVKPKGDDAYAQRMRDVMQTEAREAQNIRSLGSVRLHDLAQATAELEPPPQYVQLHRTITEMLEEISRIEVDTDTLLEDRVTRIFALRRELADIAHKLADDSSEPYAVRAAQGIDVLLRERTCVRKAVLAPLTRRSERLREVKPPRRWREKHARYVSTMDAHQVALRGYDSALDRENIDDIRNAARYTRTQQEIAERATEELLRELADHYVGRRSALGHDEARGTTQ